MKWVRYNRETRDFDMYLDGQYVGSRATKLEAETALDTLVYEQLRRAA